VTGNPLRLPEIKLPQGSDAVESWVAVRLEDPELCGRYVARVIRGVKIGPSPDWLRQRLEKVGVRSISNVVDVTNYVMLEIGEPLHAFDYHLLGKNGGGRPTIVVRRAREGEKFTTLDGQERTLNRDNLLIADETRAIALAGVMGGQNTEINQNTADVLIESAWFKPQNIRSTSKRLELRTESSYRFERGADIGIADWASRRAAQLILETAGGELLRGVVDAYAAPPAPKEVTVRHRKTTQLLGIEIPAAQAAQHLQRLGLDLVEESAEICRVRIPTFRVDLKREVDLIEEIGRLHGVEKIPSTPPRGAVGSNEFDSVHDEHAEARRFLIGLGLSEAQGQTLISSPAARLVTDAAVALQNPLSSDMNMLRPSLIPGLLDTLRHNLNRKNNDVAVFEIGRVFRLENGAPREQRNVAIALTGLRQGGFWSGAERDATFDVFDLKGVLEEFLEQFGVRGVNYLRRNEAVSPFIESAVIQLGGKLTLGEIGQLSPLWARRYDLRDRVLLAELNLDMLVARRKTEKSFKPLPAFPEVRRDVAMILPESMTHETVLNAIRKLKPANLERVELFDVFHGRNIPSGQKSMAYAFTYRHPERTLTDAEVNAAHEKIMEQFRKELSATIRD
jgi:phenylalanyl-tRNA synthetase beta chain